jgi:hypothetical protein
MGIPKGFSRGGMFLKAYQVPDTVLGHRIYEFHFLAKDTEVQR